MLPKLASMTTAASVVLTLTALSPVHSEENIRIASTLPPMGNAAVFGQIAIREALTKTAKIFSKT